MRRVAPSVARGFMGITGRPFHTLTSLDSGEDDPYLSIREGVRALCERFPDPYWREMDRDRNYPTDFVDELTRSGYLAALVPQEYGGSGLPLMGAAAVLEEIHASGCNGSACHAQMYTMGCLLRHGTDAQKQEHLPAIAEGTTRLQAFGVSEPSSGSDTTSLKTVATKLPGGGYSISGSKVWTSRAEHSDLMLLLARTTPRSEVTRKAQGLSLFLVDMREAQRPRADGTAPLTIRPLRTMMNHNTTEIFLDGIEVPDSALIGEEGRGFYHILDGWNAERILIAAECCGDAAWFLDRATKYAKTRTVFDRPIGQNQGIQFPLARAYAQTLAARLAVKEAGRRFEAGKPCGREANVSKMLASEASWAAAEACLQTHGGYGFAEEFDVERKYRETRLYQVAPISTNMILAFLAEHELGLPRSY